MKHPWTPVDVGVSVRERNDGLIDKKYHNGSRVTYALYARQPPVDSLRFRSPMMNDYNQHLCNGWFHPEIERNGSSLDQSVERVAAGLKPLATKFFRTRALANDLAKDAAANGFLASVSDIHGNWSVTISIKGTLEEIFDMEALASDYERHSDAFRAARIRWHARTRMEEFHFARENQFGKELEGLLYGYPHGNTMSIIDGAAR